MRHGDASNATFRRMTSLSTTNGRGCPLSGSDAIAGLDSKLTPESFDRKPLASLLEPP